MPCIIIARPRSIGPGLRCISRWVVDRSWYPASSWRARAYCNRRTGRVVPVMSAGVAGKQNRSSSVLDPFYDTSCIAQLSRALDVERIGRGVEARLHSVLLLILRPISRSSGEQPLGRLESRTCTFTTSGMKRDTFCRGWDALAPRSGDARAQQSEADFHLPQRESRGAS